MIETISKLDVYIGLAINGIATGLGATIGTYIANHQIIEGMKNFFNKIKGGNYEQKSTV